MRSLQELYMAGGEDRAFAVDFAALHKEDPALLERGEWLVCSECWRQTGLFLLNKAEDMQGRTEAEQDKLAEYQVRRYLWDCEKKQYCGWPHGGRLR
ncbi:MULTISPECIES: hypothetical protein [unclassified Streptomyces]|uniref:hypothetical protein n=1 Tax=unclassified Streptomyces TaxID=2593676 RepID=UPI0023658ECA|nr:MULTISPECIES: hypothetical protein [unclassified Streptomyces]MDF3142152.1 hypothetical protein [Streptomyces sp. T21Q-yed]WDF43567.1 hypothetical protein PBV52_45725 [Streptomyces sp. T12]